MTFSHEGDVFARIFLTKLSKSAKQEKEASEETSLTCIV